METPSTIERLFSDDWRSVSRPQTFRSVEEGKDIRYSVAIRNSCADREDAGSEHVRHVCSPNAIQSHEKRRSPDSSLSGDSVSNHPDQ
jgi:hypothetical protein